MPKLLVQQCFSLRFTSKVDSADLQNTGVHAQLQASKQTGWRKAKFFIERSCVRKTSLPHNVTH